MTLGEAERDPKETANCLPCNEDENKEEKWLGKAIALSEGIEKENDEEELLRQAIALSLQDWI